MLFACLEIDRFPFLLFACILLSVAYVLVDDQVMILVTLLTCVMLDVLALYS